MYADKICREETWSTYSQHNVDITLILLTWHEKVQTSWHIRLNLWHIRDSNNTTIDTIGSAWHTVVAGINNKKEWAKRLSKCRRNYPSKICCKDRKLPQRFAICDQANQIRPIDCIAEIEIFLQMQLETRYYCRRCDVVRTSLILIFFRTFPFLKRPVDDIIRNIFVTFFDKGTMWMYSHLFL